MVYIVCFSEWWQSMLYVKELNFPKILALPPMPLIIPIAEIPIALLFLLLNSAFLH